MLSCKNGKGSYKGTEPSPKGNGYCARYEKIGTRKRGHDKKMWVVRSVKLATGKRFSRWFRVSKVTKAKKVTKKTTKKPTKKQTRKPTKKPTKRKRPSSAKSTKSTKPKPRKKRLKGGVKRSYGHDRIVQQYLTSGISTICKKLLSALYRTNDDMPLPITPANKQTLLEKARFSNPGLASTCVEPFVKWLRENYPRLFTGTPSASASGASASRDSPGSGAGTGGPYRSQSRSQRHTRRAAPYTFSKYSVRILYYDQDEHSKEDKAFSVNPDERVSNSIMNQRFPFGSYRLIYAGSVVYSNTDNTMRRWTWKDLIRNHFDVDVHDIELHLVYTNKDDIENPLK